jgi:predicted TIM-barrel fold metal-dependent hydrolase
MTVSLPVVDIHNHVIAPDATRYPLAPMGGKQSEWSLERPVDDVGMLAAMREAGVAKSVLVQASTCYGNDNSYVADTVKAHPQAFVGVYSVDMTATDACARIGHWADAGLVGLRVFIAGHTAADKGARLDDPRAFPAWQYASDHGIPICVQLRADGLPQLHVLLEFFPKVTVLLDHFARPELDDGAPYKKAASLFALARFPNVHFKLTTHNVRESRLGLATQASFCKAVVDAFGSHRIAWGSNFPASKGSLKSLLDEALEATAALPLADREWIFSRTAHALYPTLKA